jgi:hypothetical protein
MWLGKPESAEAIFNDLFNEVRSAAPAAQLSYNLRCRLERVEFRSRSEICSRYRSLNRNKKKQLFSLRKLPCGCEVSGHCVCKEMPVIQFE